MNEAKSAFINGECGKRVVEHVWLFNVVKLVRAPDPSGRKILGGEQLKSPPLNQTGTTVNDHPVDACNWASMASMRGTLSDVSDLDIARRLSR